MVNKGIAEQHGGPNYIELNWQAPLNFPSSAFQNKRAVKAKQNKLGLMGW